MAVIEPSTLNERTTAKLEAPPLNPGFASRRGVDFPAEDCEAANTGGAAVPGGSPWGSGQALHYRVRGGGRTRAQPNPSLEVHNFVTGMKLEALNPQDMKSIRPATVTKVFNNYHFRVTIDDHAEDYEDSKMAWICDSKHPYIFPIGWAQKYNITFKTPKIWKEGKFDWDEYLSMTSSVPAPEYCFGNKTPLKGIEVGMMLEAVNPQNHEEIHVAKIDAIVEHMLCVELLPIGEKVWYAQDSVLLFPVSWCDSNNYALHIPDTSAAKEPPKVPETKTVHVNSSEEWCDRIFFNYKCYAGPLISRNKLSQLPKHVGPGPLTLVLREVLNKMISASYKPAKLLKDWESDELPEEGMRLEMFRAKVKSGTYHAYVPIALTVDQVLPFCKDMCAKMQACPCLFGPEEYPGPCPNNCQNVDKSMIQNGTDRRGRPKESTLTGKRKRKKCTQEKKEKLLSQETASNDGKSAESEQSAGSTPPSESGTRPNSPDSGDCKKTQKKRRERKNEYPKLEMKTRGAKLPNFAIQMKEAHWNKKDVETMYNNSCAQKKGHTPDSDTENDTNGSSSNSRDAKNISDVSDPEEPELKKLKFNTYDPLPSDNKTSDEKDTDIAQIKDKLKLSSNPMDWTVDNVYKYLNNSKDCNLIADKMRQEKINGEALVMLEMPTIREVLHIKKEFAVHLRRHITKLRRFYVDNFEYK
ncbi:scm-like with four MBT domains protein 2 [Amyelois transitella]|uniref:scm-like with four MBT domains protein 2 n=1 Tax=Amyelois transitella TaxID=680683 RepID=UPI00298F4B1F|nr:scm-like with four MBT domains protein 2 [Amyelois transitella]